MAEAQSNSHSLHHSLSHNLSHSQIRSRAQPLSLSHLKISHSPRRQSSPPPPPSSDPQFSCFFCSSALYLTPSTFLALLLTISRVCSLIIQTHFSKSVLYFILSPLIACFLLQFFCGVSLFSMFLLYCWSSLCFMWSSIGSGFLSLI